MSKCNCKMIFILIVLYTLKFKVDIPLDFNSALQ